MELCNRCKRMTAEKNHYTGKIICYNRFCDQEAKEMESKPVKIILTGQALMKEKGEEGFVSLK